MSKNNTIAVVNRKHDDKELMSLDSTSGESSDSDETIHSEFDSDGELDEGLEIVDMNITRMMKLTNIQSTLDINANMCPIRVTKNKKLKYQDQIPIALVRMMKHIPKNQNHLGKRDL